jgi:diguanylate cyclase (GGDEF)-like protein/putative nucleotidyltransferase with HDIG domain
VRNPATGEEDQKDVGASAEILELREQLEQSEAHIAQTMMRATRLAQVISVLGTRPEPGRVSAKTIERVAVELGELFFCDVALLMLQGEDGLNAAGSWGIAEADLPVAPIVLHAVDSFLGDEIVRIGSAGSVPLPDWLTNYPLRHLAWVRLTVGAHSLGLMMIGRCGEEPFEASDATELRPMAYRIALAIENDQLSQRMLDQLALLHRLQELTTKLAGTIELDEVAALVATALVEEVGVVASRIVLTEDERGDVDSRILVSAGAADPAGSDERDWHRLELEVSGKRFGAIEVLDPPAVGSPAHETLMHLISLGALSLDKALRYAQSQERARRDSLTGLLAHRSFHETVETLITAGDPFSVLLVDIDDFKQINDVYGHQTGDLELRRVAQALRHGIRSSDNVFRIGGEEFCAVVAGLEAADAFSVAEQLRQGVTQSVRDLPVPLTVSVGVASFPEHGVSRDLLLEAADKAMYASKRGGKNRSTIAGGTGQEAVARERDVGLILLQNKDPETVSHSMEVAILSVELGMKLKLDDRVLDRLRTAARLHDVGKIGVPDYILLKPGPLDDDEFRIIKTHPVIGAELLRSWGLADAAEIVRHHHERIDGDGYPDGLAGEQIEIEARIIHVTDAYIAMTHDRPYRAAISREDAFVELACNTGTQFDAAIVAALTELEREAREDEACSEAAGRDRNGYPVPQRQLSPQ